MIDAKKFFDGIRVSLFNGRLAQRQVDGINAILDEWLHRKLADLRWLAYMLATVYWETAHTSGRSRNMAAARVTPRRAGPGHRPALLWPRLRATHLEAQL
jgi:hypothetical protein